MSEETDNLRSQHATWPGYAACAWALVFATMSFYWAAGGMLGISTQAQSIQELAQARKPSFIAIVWVTGVFKLIGGLVALATVQRWGRILSQRALSFLMWSAGVGMLLYGGLGLIVDSLRWVNVIPVAEAARSGVHWHVLLWDPWWLFGGILYSLAAWRFGRTDLT